MWHLFDRYKGVVWPKARQLNLIARILNNLCQGTGIKLDLPTNPSPASPVTISVDEDWLDGKIGGEGSGAGVESVNAEDGALTVNGGKNIRVDTANKVITISYEEGKEPDEGAVEGEETPDCNDWTGGGEDGEAGGSDWGDDDGGGKGSGHGGGAGGAANCWSGDDDGEDGGGDGGAGGEEDVGDGNGWGGDSCAELNGW